MDAQGTKAEVEAGPLPAGPLPPEGHAAEDCRLTTDPETGRAIYVPLTAEERADRDALAALFAEQAAEQQRVDAKVASLRTQAVAIRRKILRDEPLTDADRDVIAKLGMLRLFS